MSICDNKATFRYTWPGRDESFICAGHSIGLQAIAGAIQLHLQLIPLRGVKETCKQEVSGDKCQACLGSGLIADDEDHTPWKYWEELEPPANIAVTMGMVKPVICEKCKGNCYL